MIALYILGGLLLLILLILILPVRLRVTYDQTLKANLRILFVIPYTLYDESKPEKPTKEQAASDKPKEEKKKKKTAGLFKERAAELKARGAAGLLDWLRDVARFALGATRRVLRAVKVRRFDLTMRVVGEDAADTALTCGRWCAAVYPLLGTLMCAIRTRRSNIKIEPDFLGVETTYTADVRVSVSPWRALWAALWALFGFLKLTKPSPDEAESTADYRREQKIKRAAEKKIKHLEKQKQQKEAS